MAITITDRTKLRPTTDTNNPNNGQYIPAVARVAITNPGPVYVHSSSPAAAGEAKVDQATNATRAKYLGYNIKPNVNAGGALGVHRGITVEGFTGAVAGDPVYIDTTSADNSGTASGLTHTAPTVTLTDSGTDTVNAGALVQPIGVALSTTRIRFH